MREEEETVTANEGIMKAKKEGRIEEDIGKRTIKGRYGIRTGKVTRKEK